MFLEKMVLYYLEKKWLVLRMRVQKELTIFDLSENMYYGTHLFHSSKTPFQYKVMQLKYIVVPIIAWTLLILYTYTFIIMCMRACAYVSSRIYAQSTGWL